MPVLQVVGPVADDQLAVVDLDREPRRPLADLGRVVEPQAPAAARGRRRLGDDVGDEAVQLRGRDPLGGAVGELAAPSAAALATLRPRVAEQVTTAGRRRSLRSTRARASSMSVVVDVPLVQHQQGRAAGLHRQLGDPQVLGGDALGGVADDDRDVGALDRPFGAQLGVVVDACRRPWSGGAGRRCRPGSTGGRRPRARCRSRRGWCRRASETITRSEPRKALTSEDLPTLGRPITATRTASSSSARGGAVAERSTIASSRSPVPSPWVAETGERLAEPELVELGGRGARRRAGRLC